MNIILIWHELQIVPATLYGNANYGMGNYTIHIKATRAEMDQAKEANPSAVIYHFTGSSGGSGPR